MAVATPTLLRRPPRESPGGGSDASRDWRLSAAVALALIALVVVTRLPFASQYLFSFDSVNFALALENFDPRLHQPQPPGYPLFVAEAKLLHWIIPDAQQTFVATGLIGATVAPLLLCALGARMFSWWTGTAAALLFVLNPVAWFSSVASPIRIYLAVFSILAAYLSYRAAAGEPRMAWAAAVAFAVAGGFRPDLLVLLFPLWLVCSWKAFRSVRHVVAAAGFTVLTVLAWWLPMALLTSGDQSLWSMFAEYLESNSEEASPLFGGGFWLWWQMFAEGFVWIATGVVGWFWAIPLLAGTTAHRESTASKPHPLSFVLLWIGPTLLFSFLVHAASPGHTLAVIPALCLVGAAVVERAARRASRWLAGYGPRCALLAAALAVNVWFLTYPFRIPHERKHIRGALPQVGEQFRFWGAFALYWGSHQRLLAETALTEQRLGFLRALGPANNLVIVHQDDDVTWRKIAYYFPQARLWTLEGLWPPGTALSARAVMWRENLVAQAHDRDGGSIALPSGSRLAWLLHLHSPIPDQLGTQHVPLRQFGRMFLTDLSAAPAEFQAGGFRFHRE